jgi:phenylalanyl-tRNA synthetase alpha chain
MEDQLAQLETRATNDIQSAKSLAELDAVRVQFMGKKGELTGILRGMGALSQEDRPHVGSLVNATRETLETLLNERKTALSQAERDAALSSETIDVTLPSPLIPFGKRHPLTQTLDDVVRIFSQLGYGVMEGPEVETEYYNFDALNIGPDHPARDERDSLYVAPGIVLRTETSAVQIRTMESRQPPVKIIAPGRVYRRDAVDRTHSPMFHQVEGLLVDRDVSFADLKGTLTTFLTQLFDALPGSGGLKTRFRPHYFPFTEPSAEFDVFFNGDWLELGGCGMVHPKVLENVGYDAEKYSGFAFGFGIERMAMIKFGIDDIRLFYENDLRFLNQF